MCVGQGCHGAKGTSYGGDGVVANRSATLPTRCAVRRASSTRQLKREAELRRGHGGGPGSPLHPRSGKRFHASSRSANPSARYQPASRSSAVHGLSRSSAKRWAWRLSGGRRRRTCLATEPSTPAVPFVHPAGTPTRHRAQTRTAMVATADLRLAPMYLSERS